MRYKINQLKDAQHMAGMKVNLSSCDAYYLASRIHNYSVIFNGRTIGEQKENKARIFSVRIERS